MLGKRKWSWLWLVVLIALPGTVVAGKAKRKVPTNKQQASYVRMLKYNRIASKRLQLLIDRQETFTKTDREQKAYLMFRLGSVHYNNGILSSRVLRWCKAYPKQRCPVRPHYPRIYQNEGVRIFTQIWNKYPRFSKRSYLGRLLARYYRKRGNLEKAKQFQSSR